MLAVIGFLALVALDPLMKARYEDVSGDPAHAEWIGRQCVVLEGLRAHGFTLGKKGVTHEVDVTPLPGIGGREITFTTPIPPFDRISYGIAIPSIPELAPYKVFARAQALTSKEARCQPVQRRD